MIGKLVGKIAEIDTNFIILDTASGVGYKVYLPAIYLRSVAVDTDTTLYIYTAVRENDISLYGFGDKETQKLFTILLNVSGIGPKSALTIVGFTYVKEIIKAVKEQNVGFFSHIPGIGKKTAQKILLEIASKFDTEFSLEKTIVTEDDQTLLQALMALGFERKEAQAAVEKTPKADSIESRVTSALKNLNKK